MEVQNGQNNNRKKKNPDYINSRSFAFSIFYEMGEKRFSFFFFFNWRNAPFPLCVAQLCGYVTNIYHLHVKYAKSQKIPSEISTRYQNKYPLFDFFLI